ALGAALVAAIASASWRLSPLAFRGQWLPERLVAAQVTALGAAVLPATVLGHFGLLSARGVFASAAAFFAASLLARPPEASGPAGPVHGPERHVLGAAVLGVAAFVLVSAYAARDLPPGVHAYDDTSYHLTAVATWRDSGDLRMVKFPVGDGATAFYPIAGELWSFFLLSALDPSDYLARFSELPFAVGALFAIAAIARRLGASVPAAGAGALLYATVPRVFPELMLSAGNDNVVAFLVLALVLALLSLSASPVPSAAAFAGLTFGLLVGTKYTGLILSLPLLALVPAALLAGGAKARGRGGWPGSAALFGLVASLAGGYTYLRNLVTAGNPVFPAPVRLLGRVLFEGWSGASVEAWRDRPEYPIEPFRFLLGNVEMYGPLFRVLVLPAAVLAPFAALAWLRGRPRLAAAAVLLLPAVFYAEFLFLMIDHRDVRYFLAAIALGCAAVAFFLDRLPGATWLRGGLALASLGFVASSLQGKLRAGVLVAAALGACLPALRRLLEGRAWVVRVGALPLAIVAGGGAVAAFPRAVASYEARRLEESGAAAALQRLTSGQPGVVAVVGTNQPYLYSGSRLQNRARYVPTGKDLSTSFYEWRGGLRFPNDETERSAWRGHLVALGVDFLVVHREGNELPELGWIEAEPDAFARVFRRGVADVYRVRRDVLVRPSVSPGFALDARSPTGASYLDGDWLRVGPAWTVPASGGTVHLPPLGGAGHVTLRFAAPVPAPVALAWEGKSLDPVPAGATVAERAVPVFPAGRTRRLWLSAGPTAPPAPPNAVGRSGAATEAPLRVESRGFWAGGESAFRVGDEVRKTSARGYTLLRVGPGGGVREVRSFDTGDPGRGAAASREMLRWVAGLSPGEIVLGAVTDDGASGLSTEGAEALGRLGCVPAGDDAFRWGHAFVGVAGAPLGSIPEARDVRPVAVGVGLGGPLLASVEARFASERSPALEVPDLPVSVDNPSEDLLVRGELFVRGWCQEMGGGPVAPVELLVDGFPLPARRLSRVPRPDVATALPEVGDASRAGYEAWVDVSGLAPGPHVLAVVFETPDGRWRRYPDRRFRIGP
ncbi:MAG: hypothetical protein DYH06_15645, partial [Acidobacteria bacterium ACB2]|nr:hypothetical protein [Acidobacteria bacterium ACB2]